jgi:flagellar basal body-associated protein FliL
MKHKTVLIIMLVAIRIFAVVAIQGISFDFRKTRWGMPKEDVIHSEGREPETDMINVEGFNNVVFTDHLLGKSVGIIYHFVQSQLFASRYQLMEYRSNSNDYFTDFKDFKQGLTKKYGKPRKEVTNWKNDMMKDKPQYHGHAVLTGDLEKFAYWETETTSIVLQLKGNKDEVNCAIRYETKDAQLQKLVEEHRETQVDETL